ncbi:MAG: hypothetical protein ACU84Q_10560 [Gammaproteobacteria bacterium]
MATYTRIEIYCDSYGVAYVGSKIRLINCGLATIEMFPDADEAWRGNGFSRKPDEPLWSVERFGPERYKVKWGLLSHTEIEN